ncbi:MAG TPA: thioredoxin [Gemmatimonadaceae bacterium]|nr:thioredoxin [Gemmatimonadaceae bacterium]
MSETTETTTAAPSRGIMVRCQFCQSWNRVDPSRVPDRPKCGKCAKPMLLDRPIALDDETFERTIAETEIPVMVDFHADWCGPCKAMAPAVDELARKAQGRLLVAKVDTERAQKTAMKFRISAVPTVIVFEGGKEVNRQAGAVPLAGLEKLWTNETN